MNRMASRFIAKRPPRGIALVIVLFFIVIITVMIVGFFESSRADRGAAGSHLERMRATLFAREGVESGVAALRRETTDKVRNWTSSPGVLVVPDDPTSATSDQSRLKKEVWLHSGLSDPASDAALDPVLRAPNLNIQTFDTASPTYLLTDQINITTTKAEEMKLLWVYVRQDGTYELPDPTKPISGSNLPKQTPSRTNKTNPIVGRFAYWTDDESTKVNYNLAWVRDAATNKNPSGHPTNVDLRALPAAGGNIDANAANAIHSFITVDNYSTIKRFFNSPFDARQITDTATRDAVAFNKFNLTHYNSDPDTTYYGKPRMMLTTQIDSAALRDAAGNPLKEGTAILTRPFLDILERSNPADTSYIDPGTRGVVDGAKLTKVVNDLVENYLKRSDWPMVDGANHSLQEKYYGTYSEPARTQRLAQVALNIIDYVRSAESKLTLVEPLRAKWIGSVFVDDDTNSSIRGQEDTFKGLPRGIYITEMGIWVSTKKDAAGKSRALGVVEVHLPKDYGIDSFDFTPGKTDGKSWSVWFNGTEPTVGRRVNKDDASPKAFVWEAVGSGNETKMVMKPGDYRTICVELPTRNAPSAGEMITIRGAISVAGGGRIDVVPLANPPAGAKQMKVPLKSAADELDIQSFESNDPRVNGIPGDWTLVQTSSFGKENPTRANSVGKPPATGFTPSQDLDVSGNVSAASLRMPYPKGHANNLTGRVRSSGELGLIHTGIEGSSTAPTGAGVPWRTLHLQPTKQATTVVPDWAFMDLFTVPADVPLQAAALFAPHSNSTGGRVNMNAKPAPFNLTRTDPLAAVLFGARKSTLNNTTLSLTEAKTIAKAIYDQTLAQAAGAIPAGKRYPQTGPPNPVYESPGEVVEIAGVADKGEESEELIRAIANLITARGSVFSIYTVGQALKQTPTGKLIVTAEQRQQAMVERFLRDKGTAATTDDEIGLRTVYFRNLAP